MNTLRNFAKFVLLVFLNFFGHPLRSCWESFHENLLIKLRNQYIFEKFKLNRNLQTITFKLCIICLCYVIGSQNERWGGSALNHLPLLFCKSMCYIESLIKELGINTTNISPNSTYISSTDCKFIESVGLEMFEDE